MAEGNLTTAKRSTRILWISIALLSLGAFLRFWDLSSMEFKGDEQEALNLGIRLLDARPWATAAPWPQTGMYSSNGIQNPPLFNSIMALFWALTHHPVLATALVALTNWFSLFPLYLWARRRFRDTRALLILAYFAVSPFAVIYSRKLWAPDLLLPGLVCLVWGLEWLRAGRTWRALSLLGVAVLIVGQMHLSGPIAVVLLPAAIAIQVLVDRRQGQNQGRWAFRPGWPTIGEGVAFVAVIGLNFFYWMPYLDYVRHLPSGIWAERPKNPTYWPEHLRLLFRQVVPQDIFYFFLPQQADFLNERVPFLSWILRRIGYYGAFSLGFPLAAYGAIRWLRQPQVVPVLGFWWIAVLAAFALAQTPSFPHYILLLAPLPALLVTGAFDEDTPPPDVIERGLTALRIAYLVALTCLTVGTLSWLSSRGGAQGDYDVVFSAREAQAVAVVEMLNRKRPAGPHDPTEVGPAEEAALICHEFRSRCGGSCVGRIRGGAGFRKP